MLPVNRTYVLIRRWPVGRSSSDLPSHPPGRSGGQAHPHGPGPTPTAGTRDGSDEPGMPVRIAAPGDSGKLINHRAGTEPSPPKASNKNKKAQLKHRPLVLDLAAVADVEGLAQE